MKYIVSTTALCRVSVEVEADDADAAVDVAAEAPHTAWTVGDLCLDGVDLSEGDVFVAPAEER